MLGAAILDADIIPKMVETLRPEIFYARQNGEIFSEIVRLFTGSAPVDCLLYTSWAVWARLARTSLCTSVRAR